ncbi:MAG: hypothetical protein WA020_15175 [Candidatus Acidiferrales bacterium]
MRKATILAVFVAVGLAYGASEAWKTKPYQQWDENDVKEILTTSPWVKHTTVLAIWKKDSLSAPDTGGQSQPNQPSPSAQQRPGMGGGGGAQPSSPEQPSMGSEGSDASFLVRWSSAQTVREAVARDAVLNGHSSEAQAEQYVDQTPPVYEVLVYGMDMTPFANETNDTLKSKAYIEVKPSKEKVSPSSVEIVKDTDGKKIESVVFSFPKQGANGQPLFAADDKQAQFDCKLKDIHLNTAFDLRKMMGKNGRDL